MIEILSRGKRVDTGEWVYGYMFKCNTYNKVYIYSNEGLQPKIEVIPETAGQLRYTKEDVKYFDGDIYYHAGYGLETVSDLCELQIALIHGDADDIGEITGTIHDKKEK